MNLNIDVLTLFPEMIEPVAAASMLGRASKNGILDIRAVNIRDFTQNKHKKTDDTPFGGGAGMVMSAQPVFDALRSVDAQDKRILYMSAPGQKAGPRSGDRSGGGGEPGDSLRSFMQGIDERIIDFWKPEEISIGDYILTGRKLAAMVVVDAVARMIPSVLGNQESHLEESVYSGLIEYPQDTTKPRVYEEMEVPEVLLSGNHKLIHLWKFEKACEITKERRPDLWEAFVRVSERSDERREKNRGSVCAERKQSVFISDGKAAGRSEEYCGGLLRPHFQRNRTRR